MVRSAFEPRKGSIQQAQQRDDWTQDAGRQCGSDLVDAATAPWARMTVGFGRVARGERVEGVFPYDEVVVVLSGAVTVRAPDGGELRILPGEFLYMPADSSNALFFEEETDFVYVADPPDVYARHAGKSDSG